MRVVDSESKVFGSVILLYKHEDECHFFISNNCHNLQFLNNKYIKENSCLYINETFLKWDEFVYSPCAIDIFSNRNFFTEILATIPLRS